MLKRTVRIIVAFLCVGLCAGILYAPRAAADDLGYSAEGTKYTRDFNFGLGDLKQAVGNSVYDRFLNKKAELPDEIPVFKPYEPVGKREFYVSNDGNDRNPGTKEKPFQTIQHALNNMKNVNDRSGGVVIYIRGGNYDVSKGLVIPEYASGTKDAPLIISSYEDEEVRLVGGISFSGKTLSVADDELAQRKLPSAVHGKVYSVNLSALGITDYGSIKKAEGPPKCFVDGVEFNLARYPNAGTIPMRKYGEADGQNGVVRTGPIEQVGSELGPATGDTGEGFEFAIADNRPFTWENTGEIWMYGSWYEEWNKHYAQVRTFNADKKTVHSVQCTPYGARYSKNNAHYYLNVLEELDAPGEWFIDSKTGMFYMYPLSENLDDVNITITTTANDIVTFENCQYVVLNGVTVEAGGNNGIFLGGRYNLVQNCVIQDVVNYGVHIKANNSGLITSTIQRTGNYSLYIYPRNDNRGINDRSFLTPTRNFVQNCYLYDGARGIFTGACVQNIFSHNCVMNPRAMGINIVSGNDIIIEYNEVVGGPYVNDDSGHVYISGSGVSIGDHIRYNYLHDSRSDGPEKKVNAIYMDDRASGHYAYGNILRGDGIFSHGGSNNVIENNILIDIELGKPSLSNSLNYYNGYESRWADRTVKNGSEWYGLTNYSSVDTNIWYARYPEFYNWTELLREHQKNYLSIDHVRDELEDLLRMPRDSVFKNNLLYNADDYTKLSVEHNVVYEDNQVYTEDPGFVDYVNCNYDLKDDSPVFASGSGFYKLPSQKKMGVIPELFDAKPKMNAIVPIAPVSGENEYVTNIGVVLQWTQAFGATYYDVEVAKDEDFKNIVAKTRTAYTSFALDELEFGTTYYWRVTAQTLAQCMDSTPSVMPVSSFKVYTMDAAIKYLVPDTYAFEEELKAAQEICNSIIEDDGTDHGFGVYKQGAKVALNQVIASAEKTMNSEKIQSVLDSELAAFKMNFIKELAEQAIPYTRKLQKFDEAEWINSTPANSTVKISEDGSRIDVTSNARFIWYNKQKLSPREGVAFAVKYDNLNDWTALNIKQLEAGVSSPTQTDGYYLVVKQEVIELQRQPLSADATDAVLVSVNNDNQIIKAGEWYDITTLAETTSKGVHIVFTVNGETIIDYVDTKDPVYGLGNFAFMHNVANGGMSLRAPSGENLGGAIKTFVLEQTINQAQQFADSIIESVEPKNVPTYQPGTKDQLKCAVEAAQKTLATATVQDDITRANQILENELFEIKKSNANPAITRLSTDVALWTPFTEGSVDITSSNGILSLKPKNSMNVMYCKKLTSKESIAFDLNLEMLNDWTAISVRQPFAADRPTKTRGYFFVLKSDVIELQKYTASGAGTIVASVENNGKYVTSGKWHAVQACATNTENGVLLTLELDGKMVIEYLDTDEPIYDEGTAAIFCNAANGIVQIK